MSKDINFFVTDENVWLQVISEKNDTFGRPALFMDRDGVIVEEVNYLHRKEDVSIIPGAIEVIRRANVLNIPVIILTNQAGVGRRYYSWKHFAEVQNEIHVFNKQTKAEHIRPKSSSISLKEMSPKLKGEQSIQFQIPGRKPVL